MNDIRAVFFDLVGTLIRSRRPIGEQYAAWARKHGAARADPARLAAAFVRAMQDAPPMAFPGLSLEATARAERGWWHRLVAKVVGQCGLDDVLEGARFERFFSDLYAHFTTSDAWEAFPDARPALAALGSRGLTVGLVTNYDTRVYAVLDAVGLADLLDSVTIPALAGAAKPDPAIFMHAVRRHGVEPSRSIYVGDELGDDYAGATAAGLKAILIDREEKHAAEEVRKIGDLGELVLELTNGD